MKSNLPPKFYRSCARLILASVVISFASCESGKDEMQQAESRPESEYRVETDAEQLMTLDEFLAQLREAANNRDIPLMASLMTPNFGYQLDPPLEGEGVFEYWDNNNLWNELALTVNEEFVSNGSFMVAPPEFADPSIPYTAYRAGVTQIDGRWRFAYFVRN